MKGNSGVKAMTAGLAGILLILCIAVFYFYSTLENYDSYTPKKEQTELELVAKELNLNEKEVSFDKKSRLGFHKPRYYETSKGYYSATFENGQIKNISKEKE